MDLAPLLPTDTPGGYKQKIHLGAKKVRKWKWIQFTNPGRKDGAVFHHWRREGDEAREYPFAKFNRVFPILIRNLLGTSVSAFITHTVV